MAEISFKALVLFVLLYFVAFSEALQDSEAIGSIEPRGKKKKLALLFFVAEAIIKKFFVIKAFYTVVFLFVLHKAGHLIKWLASYLKEHKYHDYHEVEYYHQPHYNKEYGPPGQAYGTPASSYGSPQDNSYMPYRRYNPRSSL